MMKKLRIFRLPWLYSICYYWVMLHHRLYYRKYTVAGMQNLPKGVPLIFAANHQNALMDALAVLFARAKPVGFLARADIFKKPSIAAILNFLKILPIYRIRDGVENLSLNDHIFEQTNEVLQTGLPICILPEGNHDGKKRLRPLKKGVFRIAFQAEEAAGFSMGLCIIPVGLDFSNYFNPGSDLLLVFGKPIRISDYRDLYLENPAKANHQLQTVLADELKKVMIHIPEDHYDAIYQLTDMYEPHIWNKTHTRRHLYNKLVIKQFIVQKIEEVLQRNPQALDSTASLLASYRAKLEQHRFSDWLMHKGAGNTLLLLLDTLLSVVLLPLHLFGTLTNYIPYKISTTMGSRMKDPQFKSSMQFGYSLILMPVFSAVIITIFGLAVRQPALTLAFGLSLPVSGLFALYNYKHMRKLWGRLRVFTFNLFRKHELADIMRMRAELIEQMKNITNN